MNLSPPPYYYYYFSRITNSCIFRPHCMHRHMWSVAIDRYSTFHDLCVSYVMGRLMSHEQRIKMSFGGRLNWVQGTTY